jgi:putative ABC transport system ATP-binding protein
MNNSEKLLYIISPQSKCMLKMMSNMMNRTNEFAIELVDLKKIFTMGKMVKVHALRGVNLKVRNGEMVSIIGPSGSGKSTVLNLLGALDRPTSGKIIIDGINIARLKDDALSRFRNRKIGFIFQSYNLINRSTVTKNIELPAIIRGIPRTIRKQRANELLDLVGLRGKANRKPTELSGGEQQRVAIARALINEPAFILADEPTGNLDSKTGQQIGNLLLRVNEERKTTIVIVTHNVELAEKSERILHLRDGIVEKEPPGLVFHNTSIDKNSGSAKSINEYQEQ